MRTVVPPHLLPERQSCDRSASDFMAGAGEGIHVAAISTGPEVILTPTVVAEFNGDGLPQDWEVELWKDGGGAVPGGGLLRLEGARA